jgi:hypothetical protein
MLRRALGLAAILALAACGPAAPPAAPLVVASAEPVAPAPPPPPAPTQVSAGAMPADVELYAELTGVRDILTLARVAAGGALFDEVRAGVAREMGVSPALLGRLLDGLVSVHVGGRVVPDDVKLGVSFSFEDAQPVRELIASGLVADAGPYGIYGRRLKGAEIGGKEVLAWFEGPRLLVWGDEPIAQAAAAVVEGRAPGLSEAQRRPPAAMPGEDRHAAAFVSPALLDRLADGAVTFPAPLTAGYGLWEGGLRGALRGVVAARELAGLTLPPARPLTLARRLPAETASYLALSTALPGGEQGASKLLAQLAGGDEELRRAIGGVDALLAEVGLRLADVLGSLGDEGVLAVSVRQGLPAKAELEKNFALIVAVELSDPRPTDKLLKLARDKAKAKPKKVKVRADGTGFSADLLDDPPVPYVRAARLGSRLFVGAGPKDLVDRAALAIDKAKGTLGDDPAHQRALRGLPDRAQARMWIDLSRAAALASALRPAQGDPLQFLRGADRQGPERLTSGMSLTLTPEDDRIRVEIDEINGLGVLLAAGLFGARSYGAKVKAARP